MHGGPVKSRLPVLKYYMFFGQSQACSPGCLLVSIPCTWFGDGRRRQALLMWMRMDYSKSCLPSPVWFAWLHMGSALLTRQALVSLTQNLVLSSFVSTARVCKCRGALTMKPFTMECLDFIEKSQSPPICHVALSTVVILDE